MLYNIDLQKHISKIRKYKKGSVIYKQGDTDLDAINLILKGKAATFQDYGLPNEVKTAYLEAGDFFGVVSSVLGLARTETVVCEGESIILVIGGAELSDFLCQEGQLTGELIKALCARLEEQGAQGESLGRDRREEQAKTRDVSPLFPPGHGQYRLPMGPDDSRYLFEKSFTCPVCSLSFKARVVKGSQLRAEKTDPDLRVRYAGVEPLYYDVVTCPQCLYSALSGSFGEGADTGKAAIEREVTVFKPSVDPGSGSGRDTGLIFAGYYLALRCAAICHARHHLTSGRLWLNLSRLYDDCGDAKMSDYAARQAYEAYLYAYENIGIPPKQNQQLSYILGRLSQRFGEVSAARKWYFTAITDKQGSKVIRRYAQDRAEELRSQES